MTDDMTTKDNGTNDAQRSLCIRIGRLAWDLAAAGIVVTSARCLETYGTDVVVLAPEATREAMAVPLKEDKSCDPGELVLQLEAGPRCSAREQFFDLRCYPLMEDANDTAAPPPPALPDVPPELKP